MRGLLFKAVLAGYAFSLLTSSGWAGPKVEIPLSNPEPWTFQLGLPMWIAGVSGNQGVRGYSAKTDVDAGTILQDLDFTASFTAEARKGRFGVYTDFLYLAASTGVFTPGAVAKIDVKVEQTLADLDFSWRVVQGERGWLDLLVGVRYTHLYNRIDLSPQDSTIERLSGQLVDAAFDRIGKMIESGLEGVLTGNDSKLPTSPVAAEIQRVLIDEVKKLKNDSKLIKDLTSGNPSRVKAAKKELKDRIANRFKKELSRTASLERWWIDPYVGIRAQLQLSKAFYLKAKADVGGFTVGSDITWQGYAAVGCQMTKHTYAEIGYRYLYVDYRNGGLLYNVSTQGPQVTVGVMF